MPTAASISVTETLELLDGPFKALADAFAKGEYALWLGSGISRERVVGLDGLLVKLLEFLRLVADFGDPECIHHQALITILEMGALSPDERNEIDFTQSATDWPCIDKLVNALWDKYSKVLSVEVPDKPLDYLLWVGLDFKNTFDHQTADAEHLCVGMLALEGSVTTIASPNWDGLLEAAIEELGHGNDFYRVTVTGQDLRGPEAAAKLYKFHGCAIRAIEDEENYRKLIIARSAQITDWMVSDTFKIARDQLEAQVQVKRTLMIGLSAQDENIKSLFAKVNAHQGWKWNEVPAPIVFSAEKLGDEQRNLLIGAYGADTYEANRDAIRDSSRVRAYAKPLLTALLLAVLSSKLQVVASDVSAPHFSQADYDEIAKGITHIRDAAAAADNGDRRSLALVISSVLSRARHQLQDGLSPDGVLPYYPLDNEPAHRMKGKLALASTGLREAAAALGTIGLLTESSTIKISVDDPSKTHSGALRISAGAASARVFFAANDDNITRLINAGVFAEDDDDVIVLCSREVSERQQRTPSGTFRDGRIGPRYISMSKLLSDSEGVGALRDRLQQGMAL